MPPLILVDSAFVCRYHSGVMFRSVRKTIRNFFKSRQKLRDAADKAKAKAIQKAEKAEREARERARADSLLRNASSRFVNDLLARC